MQAVSERLKCRNGLHGGSHVAQPGFAFGGSDLERQMPHPQTRMTTFFLIAQGAAEALDQEPSQMPLGVRQILGIQGTQKRVGLNTLIKGFDESVKRLILADAGVNFDRFVSHSQVGGRRLMWHTLGAVYPLPINLIVIFNTKTYEFDVSTTWIASGVT